MRTCRSLYRSSPSRAFSWLVTPMTPKYTAAPPHTCATLSNRRDISTLVLTKKQKCRVTWRAESSARQIQHQTSTATQRLVLGQLQMVVWRMVVLHKLHIARIDEQCSWSVHPTI